MKEREGESKNQREKTEKYQFYNDAGKNVWDVSNSDKSCEQLIGKYLIWVKFLSIQVWRWRTCYLISILKTQQSILNIQVPKLFFFTVDNFNLLSLADLITSTKMNLSAMSPFSFHIKGGINESLKAYL